ncbi:MAG: hypothetical protein ACNA8S_11675 [Deferrisomatales bacterium]
MAPAGGPTRAGRGKGPPCEGDGAGKPALVAWAVYDWASNAFAPVILTFVFASYFTRQVAPDVVTGTALWGYTLAAAGLAVSALGPLTGAVADQTGRRKPRGWSSSP